MLLGTSCQNEEIVSRAEGQEFSLTLDMGAKSRTMMGENGAVWGDNEALYVVGDGGKSYGTLTMVWKSEDGKSAMFSGKITGDAGKLEHMVYPVPNGGNIISVKSLIGGNHNAPMVGRIVDGEVNGLGYEGGLVKLDFSTAAEDEDFTVKATNADGELIVGGYYQFDPVNGTLTYHEVEGSTLSIDNVPANGIVWLPVASDAPKGTPETITVSVTDKYGNTISGNVNINQGGAAASDNNSFPAMTYNETTGLAPDSEDVESVNGADALKTAFTNGGQYTLTSDVTITQALTLAEGKALYLDLGEFTITADFAGGAIINNGTLNITNGYIVNDNAGTADAAGRAHGIVNYGTLTLKDVNVGSDEMGGNAVRNEGGDITINGGTFKSRDRSTEQGWGYVFYNIAGTMTINSATSTGKPNGMFSCNNGEIDVNGGTYTIESGANTWYMALTSPDGDPANAPGTGIINLNAGTFTWNAGTSCKEVLKGNVIIDHTKADCNWVTKVNTGDALRTAIANNDGKPIILVDGTYEGLFDIENKKSIVIEASNGTKPVIRGMVYIASSNVVMRGLTFTNPDAVKTVPDNAGDLVDQHVNGNKPVVGVYTNSNVYFERCVFDLTSNINYGYYSYALTNATFKGCIFNCNKIRPIANNGDAITVTGCTFNDQYHYSVRIFENSEKLQNVEYTNNTVLGTNDKGEFEGVNISKKGGSATVLGNFTIKGNTAGLKYRHHKNVTMSSNCKYESDIANFAFEKEG